MVVPEGTLVQSPRCVHPQVAVAKQTSHTMVNVKVVLRCAAEGTSCLNVITNVCARPDGADLEMCSEPQVRNDRTCVCQAVPDKYSHWVWCQFRSCGVTARHVCDV